MKKLVRVFMKLDIDLLLQNMDTAHRWLLINKHFYDLLSATVLFTVPF